ncbi:GNAT family N-acetyltransferase [Thermoflavimicrobium daqui]|uniref:GNAT family N-acetyltransferase n=1 Tax=Thermoflavimicrobium daqui TaxID=2137476 RepID=UPI0030B81C58
MLKEIQIFRIDESYRKKGLGSKLLHHMEQTAKKWEHIWSTQTHLIFKQKIFISKMDIRSLEY